MGDFTHLVRLLQKTPLEEIRAEKFFEEYCEEAWTLTACIACNGLVGASAPLAEGRWTSAERRMVAAVSPVSQNLIGRGRDVKLCPELAEKELKGKRVNYVGEEVGVCHPLSLEQVRPALPSEEHGGSIELTRFLSASGDSSR